MIRRGGGVSHELGTPVQGADKGQWGYKLEAGETKRAAPRKWGLGLAALLFQGFTV